MLIRLTLILLFIPLLAEATVVTRQHSDTIVSGKKILASDLNDEFDNLVNHANAIDSSNITSGSLTVTSFAATSSAVSLNKRFGCNIRPASPEVTTGNQSIAIEAPCEIYMDGLRGYITATQTISLTNNLIDNATPAWSTYYFIYASRNTASLTFHFSPASPSVVTLRKPSDSNSRYIGTVRTQDATNTIAWFRQQGNRFYWSQSNTLTTSGVPLTGLRITPTNPASQQTLSVPAHFTSAQVVIKPFINTAFPGQCNFKPSQYTATVNAVAIASGSNSFVVPYWVPLDGDVAPGSSKSLTASFENVQNCAGGGQFQITGWEEPDIFYK